MSIAERITRHYGGNWNAGAGQGNIPGDGHSKHDRSVSVKDAPDKPGGILVCVRGNGDWRTEMDRFRRDGLVADFDPQSRQNDAIEPRVDRPGSGEWRCTGTYEYDDGAGQVVYRTRRLEKSGQAKRFVAEHLKDGKWVKGLGDIARLPYRFTEWCEAAARARAAGEQPPLIYLVEGERKADKLASMGFLATAIAFGANGWRNEYCEAFRDCPVVILPDNDEPGRKFADKVKAEIEPYGAVVYVIELPGLPPKGDIIDWQGNADDLRTLVAKSVTGSALPLPTLDLEQLAMVKPQSKAFAIERLAPLGEVTLFTGPGSAGKSLLGQQFATASAAGLRCLGLDLMAGPAIYLTCEDDADQLHWRQEHICASLGVAMATLAGKLHLISLRGALDNDLGTFKADGTFSPSPAYHRLVAMVLATGSKLVFLDNVAHLFTGNENDRGEVTRFVNLLNRLAGDTGAAIVLLGHPNKSGDSYSGSTAWLNAVRSQFTIDHDRDSDGSVRDPDARVLTIGKANYAKKGEALRFYWIDWAFVREDDLPADTSREMAESILASADNKLFMDCLAELTRQHRAVSEKRSPTFAPAVFATMPESKRIGKVRLERAMDRLFRIDKIERAELWKGPDRKPVFGLRETAANGAVNTVRATRATPLNGAEMRAGNALETHTYTYGIDGAAPQGAPAPQPMTAE